LSHLRRRARKKVLAALSRGPTLENFSRSVAKSVVPTALLDSLAKPEAAFAHTRKAASFSF